MATGTTKTGTLETDTINEQTGDAGVTVDGVLLKDSDVTAVTVNTDELQTKTASGTFDFRNQGGTLLGSYTDAGNWQIGKDGERAYIGGGQASIVGIYSNCYVGGTLNRDNRWDTTRTGAAIEVVNNGSATNAVNFYVNADNDALDATAVNAGIIRTTGAWTIGPSAGGVTHTVNGVLDAADGVTFGGGGDNLNHYEEDSITMTPSNFTPTNCTISAATYEYTRVGKHITIRLSMTLATSSGNWNVIIPESELDDFGTLLDSQAFGATILRLGNNTGYAARAWFVGNNLYVYFDDAHAGTGGMSLTFTALTN